MTPGWKKLLQPIWCFFLTQGALYTVNLCHSGRVTSRCFSSSSFLSPCSMIFNPELFKFLLYLHSNIPQQHQPLLGNPENFGLCARSVNDISGLMQDRDLGCCSCGEQEPDRDPSVRNSSSRGGGRWDQALSWISLPGVFSGCDRQVTPDP